MVAAPSVLVTGGRRVLQAKYSAGIAPSVDRIPSAFEYVSGYARFDSPITGIEVGKRSGNSRVARATTVMTSAAALSAAASQRRRDEVRTAEPSRTVNSRYMNVRSKSTSARPGEFDQAPDASVHSASRASAPAPTASGQPTPASGSSTSVIRRTRITIRNSAATPGPCGKKPPESNER